MIYKNNKSFRVLSLISVLIFSAAPIPAGMPDVVQVTVRNPGGTVERDNLSINPNQSILEQLRLPPYYTLCLGGHLIAATDTLNALGLTGEEFEITAVINKGKQFLNDAPIIRELIERLDSPSSPNRFASIDTEIKVITEWDILQSNIEVLTSFRDIFNPLGEDTTIERLEQWFNNLAAEKPEVFKFMATVYELIEYDFPIVYPRTWKDLTSILATSLYLDEATGTEKELLGIIHRRLTHTRKFGIKYSSSQIIAFLDLPKIGDVARDSLRLEVIKNYVALLERHAQIVPHSLHFQDLQQCQNKEDLAYLNRVLRILETESIIIDDAGRDYSIFLWIRNLRHVLTPVQQAQFLNYIQRQERVVIGSRPTAEELLSIEQPGETRREDFCCTIQ